MASSPVSRTRMILVLGTLIALGPLTIDMYLPALPKIGEELSISSSVASAAPNTAASVRAARGASAGCIARAVRGRVSRSGTA